MIKYDIIKTEIPSQVRIVKNDSLKNHPNLKEIIFPENSELEIIENFSISLSPIQKLILPATLHTICDHTLSNISNLVDIQVSPKNKLFSVIDNKYLVRKSDENSPFYDFLLFVRRDIESVMIPSQIKEIGSSALQYCEKLHSISFEPNSLLETIQNGAFSNNPQLKEIVIPKLVQRMDEEVFGFNKNLISVEFLSTSITIEDKCFYYCDSLKSISFPNASNLHLSSDSLLKIPINTKIFVRRNTTISGEGYKKMKKYINYIDDYNRKWQR